MVQLLAGLIIGTAISSIAWWFILNSSKKREDNLKKERDDIMRSIGALLAELDSILTSSVQSKTTATPTHYSSKLEAINKILKSNLHLFDVYYVKYIELLLKYYNHKAEKTGLLVVSQKPVSDIEMETSFSFIDNEGEVSTIKKLSEKEIPQEVSLYEKTIPIEKEEKPKETDINDVSVDTFNKIEEFTFEKVERESKSKDVSKEMADISEKESEELLETLTIAEKEDEGVIEGEESTILEKKDDDKTKLIERTKIITDSKPDNLTKIEDVLEDVKRDDVYLNLGQEKKGTELNEEAFALETLIDVDASSILSSSQKPSEKKENNKTIGKEKSSILEPSLTKENNSSDLISSSSEEFMEVVIASDVKKHSKKTEEHLETAEVKKADDNNNTLVSSQRETTLTTSTPTIEATKEPTNIKSINNREEDEFVIEVNTTKKSDTKEQPEQNINNVISLANVPTEEEMITGDDIVNKIASWDTTKSHISSIKNEGKQNKAIKSHEIEENATSQEVKKTKEPSKKIKSSTEEEITGEDIVDKIDSFFGLIKE